MTFNVRIVPSRGEGAPPLPPDHLTGKRMAEGAVVEDLHGGLVRHGGGGHGVVAAEVAGEAGESPGDTWTRMRWPRRKTWAVATRSTVTGDASGRTSPSRRRC